MQVLLSTAYLPPISYFQKIINGENIIIEKHEHFLKQTYRNRCNIFGANGVLTLSIPLQKLSEREKINEKRISYSDDWQRIHWKSIESAYRNSPYFDFFETEFKCFYEKRFEFLFDYNTELLQMLFKILRINPSISYTSKYIEKVPNAEDLRNWFHPNDNSTEDEHFKVKPYYQVFSDKHGFKDNLSIIDILFNEGMETLNILKINPD